MVQVFVLNTIIGNRLKRKGKKLHVAFVESIAVSTEKTKVMSFRRGGKRRKGVTTWKFAGKVLEEVKEFKYLGFWFSTRNQYGIDTRKVAGRLQQIINKAWGEMRKAEVNSLARKLPLMDTTVKAGALYGVEIWG